ncbi:MAG: apolipoprotein N-acyltransferase [Zoogloea sp.]|nr:apolipoprotein N-acyltransferase [Zoogloea sp.]MCA0187322.1 apolipoprotein N-acyltransferase [Pseudomonadota bacterium]
MRLLRPGLALLAGAASVLAYAPFELFPLAFVALAVLFRLLDDGTPEAGRRRAFRRGFGLGFAWGLGALLAGVSWIYVALHRFGGMPMPLAGLAVLLFCAGMAVHAGLASALFAALRRGRPWLDAALFAAAWLLGEWLRGWLFTGFPWLASGYSQTPPSPLAGYAPLIGVYGVGGLLAFSAALAAQALRRRCWRPVAVLALVLAGGGALRAVAWTAPVGEPVKVALLQTNIEQSLKWRPEMLQRWLDINLQMLRDNPAQILVLPETTIPLLVDSLPEGYLEEVRRIAAGHGGDAILGTFTRDAEGRIYNAAISVGVSASGHYAKQHLVPFGEYSPPLFNWFYDLASIPMADQTRGPAVQAPMQLAGQKVALNICYEDVFGEELIRALPEATLLLNLSNLAWYGDSFAQPQHLQIARVRALETGRPMLRSTNTGMTALVMPDGAVQAILPAFERGALQVAVRGYAGMTPYARWGNAPAVGLAMLLVLLGLGRTRRQS